MRPNSKRKNCTLSSRGGDPFGFLCYCGFIRGKARVNRFRVNTNLGRDE